MKHGEWVATATDPEARRELAPQILDLEGKSTPSALEPLSPADLAALRALIERERPALIVFDSLVRLMGRANPDKAEEVSAFFGRSFAPIARDFGAAVLVLRHLRKPSGSDDAGSLQHNVRGSSDLPAAVRSVLVPERVGETRTLWQTKCRWQTEQPPVGIEIAEVGRRMADQRFRAELAKLRAAMLDCCVGVLSDHASGAATRIAELAHSSNEPVALAACWTVIESVLRLRHELELAARIEALGRAQTERDLVPVVPGLKAVP